jgi:hypothetical protein
VGHQVPVFAVHWHKILRAGQAQHHFQFFLAGVAVDVNQGNTVIKDFGPLAQQVVNRPADQ